MPTQVESRAHAFGNRHSHGGGNNSILHVLPLLKRQPESPRKRKTADIGNRFCSILILGCITSLVMTCYVSQLYSPSHVMIALDSPEEVVDRLLSRKGRTHRVLGGLSLTQVRGASRRHPRAVLSPSIYDAITILNLQSQENYQDEPTMPWGLSQVNQSATAMSLWGTEYEPHVGGVPLFDAKECVPMKAWHTASYPTCNDFHSFDFTSIDDQLKLVGMGGTRMVWKLDVANDVDHGGVVLRMMQWYHAFFRHLQYNSQRLDAIISERLTASPRVMNIYGFCGLSSFGEAGEKSKDWLASLYSLTPIEKLAIGREIALALVDLHSIDGDGNVTAVYRNLKPDNILLVDGKPKINDFDDGILLHWNTTGHRTCRFRLPTFPPREKPYLPAEVSIYGNPLTEKIDIYSLGGILYSILTGTRPYDKYGANNTEVARHMTEGVLPRLRSDTRNRSDMATLAMRTAFERCMSHDPESRPTAFEVAKELDRVYNLVLEGTGTQP